MLGSAAEIEESEEEFPGVFVDAGAAADDLFEFRRGADSAVEDGLRVYAGGEEAGGGDEDGVFGFGVNEVAEFILAFGIAAGYPHGVAMVLVAEVLVFLDEGLAHAGGVFFIHAEDDGFLKAVAGFLEERGDLAGDDQGEFVDYQSAVIVLGVVDAVFDFEAVAIGLAFFGAVAFDIDIDVDFVDFVRGEEAVANSFLQRVTVDGFAKVFDVRDVFSFLRGGGQADLGGGFDVVEDFAPGGIGGSAAAMAFVDDDEVEERF